ncbi:MAG TPA: hypothetical protein VGO50_02560 [Pyrinomonadaceae bacterium]|jgi:excinuclease ABC A subunit|nr:hypothetical protein [Pyrinomonadaceae bacterium]
MVNKIEIVGASTNNLKAVSLNLPLRQATMIVGVSGSGKSSLLANTLAVEANIRLRRFLNISQQHLGEEDVHAFISALPPCVHFGQGSFRASRRTTVATSSGLLALLRAYFRRYSAPWSDEVSDFVPSPSPFSYSEWIGNNYTGTLTIWVVVERWERSNGVRAIGLLRRHEIKSVLIRSETDRGDKAGLGREIELDRFRPLADNVKHLIEAKIGSYNVKSDSFEQLLFLLQKSFDIGGDVIVEFHQGKDLPDELQSDRGILLDSAKHWVHPDVKLPFARPSNALLSFNAPSNPESGACPSCQGLGLQRNVSIDKLIVNPGLSLHKGAISLWTEKNYRHVNIQHETIEGLRELHGFSPDVPWKTLSENARHLILWGSGEEAIADIDLRTGRKVSTRRRFPGFINAILRRAEGQGHSASALEKLTTEGPCQECKGTRWSREARALRLGKWSLPVLLHFGFEELSLLTIPAGKIERGLPDQAHSLAAVLHTAAESFVSAGLGHLSGERGMTTLSEGESRRSRIAALLRAGGNGLGLLLDEPARGLHEEDVTRLSSALNDLKKRHSLVINEHRLSVAQVADKIIEIGPGAGDKGGRIVNIGRPDQIFKPAWFPLIKRSRLPTESHRSWLTVEGARIHNIENITCRVPLGRMVSITGVSGSGKSSFIRGVLLPALGQEISKHAEFEEFIRPGGAWKKISGTKNISSVLALEPKTPGIQRRSTVATLLKIAEDLRRVFSQTSEARKAKLSATDFGWNAGLGRCQTCLGLGEIEDGEDRWTLCPHCGGSRFGEEVLGIRIHGSNIADILALSFDHLLSHPITSSVAWNALFEQLIALDLGYLTLGRRIDRLSGGEYQRLRIAMILSKQRPEGLMLVLDEPSAGLHPQDVMRLLKVLDHIVAKGRNTVVLVEHNLDLIRASDWIIDFGPGGGPDGGKIVGEGTASRVGRLKTPTGRALSGKISIRSSSGKQKNVKNDNRFVKTEASAKSGKQWLKRLIGEETSAEKVDPIDFEGLEVEFETSDKIRPYEIGGLDVEIGRLLLDEEQDDLKQIDELAHLWTKMPSARLLINPLIEEMRIWGFELPASVLDTVRKRLKNLGIEYDFPVKRGKGLSSIRAAGRRFLPSSDSPNEKINCIRDALAVGGGYVELAGESGLIATIQKRKLALEIPAVAPLSPSSACLVRSHSSGRCPCCTGEGAVPIFDEELVIANRNKTPTSEAFYTSEALGLLRGVRRNTLLPFFNRMTDENLWPAERSYSQLKPDEWAILMHGYWRRPGPGSFLKNPAAEPQEVGSWLRWNGLFRAIFDEIERSKAKEWVRRVQRSMSVVECYVCLGTGLQSHARAVFLNGCSFFDLIRKGTVEDLIKALEEFPVQNTRSKKTRARIIECLRPLQRAAPRALLREPIKDKKILLAVFEQTVQKMTTLKVSR